MFQGLLPKSNTLGCCFSWWWCLCSSAPRPSPSKQLGWVWAAQGSSEPVHSQGSGWELLHAQLSSACVPHANLLYIKQMAKATPFPTRYFLVDKTSAVLAARAVPCEMQQPSGG